MSGKAPKNVPLRVDIAGGWLDHPKYAREGSHVINLTISPLTYLHDPHYRPAAGLGGSAAHEVLRGNDAVLMELHKGSGWGDAAVIYETGLCAWVSGCRPLLALKCCPGFLKDRLVLWWTGHPHDAGKISLFDRNYTDIMEAAWIGLNAVKNRSFLGLACACSKSYYVQLDEGMDELPDFGETAKKYSGAGWGGYALYMFDDPKVADAVVKQEPQAMRVQPYIQDRTLYGNDEETQVE